MTSRPAVRPVRPETRGLWVIALAVAAGVLPGCTRDENAGVETRPAAKSALRVVREPEVREGDVIYGVAGNDDRLLAINPKTGSVRAVGNLGIKIGGMEDLILGPDGVAIASYWEGYPALVRINLKTGRAAQGPRIKGGSLTDKSFVESLAVINGVLYGAASHPDSYCPDCADLLVRIDPETGRATDVGKFGPKFLNMEAMAYSPEFGLIGADIGTLKPPDFGAIDTHPALVRIDPETGRATKIGDLPPSEIKLVKAPNNAPFISPEGPYICGLCFATDGTLYGSTFPTHFGGPSELVVIDPTDASVRHPKLMNAFNVDGIIYVRAPTMAGEGQGDTNAKKGRVKP
ncbi:MAG: hypothetical protein LC745_13015, partial [Planctomycetia bacterium]|nr:hypothetical protein [Planctomycetia bacterium]